MKKNIYSVLLFCVFLCLISCDGGNNESNGNPPVITSFTATPNSVQVGKIVTLSWNVTGADSVSIDNGIGGVNSSGSCDVTMDSIGSVTFTITATNAYGNDTESAEVEVNEYAWYKTFGGADDEYGHSVQQTTDGGYIIAGYIKYFSGLTDIYLVKTDNTEVSSWETVSIQNWHKTIGGSNDDRGQSVQQTSDGGYIVTGYTESFGAGDTDVYLVKIDANGNKEWQKTFGGTKGDIGCEIQKTSDGGYIITGYTKSFGAGNWDVYIIKTGSNGNKTWEKTFGGVKDDFGFSVKQTSDGKYIVAGRTESFGSGMEDVYLIKTDALGNKMWEKTYGGSSDDSGNDVQSTSDGGYVIVGYSKSFGAGKEDVYLLKINSSGNKQWQKTFGGSDTDRGHEVQQIQEGGYMIVGYTKSSGAGKSDVYIVKTDESGNLILEKTIGGSESESGFSIKNTSDNGFIISAYTSSFGSGGADVYLIKIDKTESN